MCIRDSPQSNALSGAAALTQTEIDILRLVCETKTRKEIAQELYLSEGTVKDVYKRQLLQSVQIGYRLSSSSVSTSVRV